MTPEPVLAICRFTHDASLMLLWGAFAYLWALVPRGLAHAISRRLTRLRVAAVIVAVTTTLAALPIKTAVIGEGWADSMDAGTIRAVLVDTSVGWAWMAEAVCAVLLAGTLFLQARACEATAAASGLMLAALALTGHAAMHEGLRGVAHRLNDALHVLAGGAWLGSLVPLLLVMRAIADPRDQHDAGLALRRFSTAGHAAVAVVLVSGLLNTALVLGRWPTDWSSPYQAMLSAKIALVCVMAALALFNRYGLVPRMARDRRQAASALRKGTFLEIGLGLLVLGCVSVFGLLEPA